MAQIGTLLTGAGVTTVLAGLSQTDSYLLLGDVDTAMPLQGLQVEIDGVPFINIANNAALIQAMSKWMMKTINATGVVGILLKLSTGRITRNTTLRLTNAGATTPTIFATSDRDNGVPFQVATKQINPSSYEDFSQFSALLITAPANIASLEMVFRTLDPQTGKVIGYTKSTISFQEADAMFSMDNDSEANGELAGVTVLDNRGGTIESVRVNCVTVALTVAVIKLPDASFQLLKSA